MSFLNVIISDLREKRLWPVALVLLAALVAVPVLLSGKSSPAGSAAVSLKGAPADAHLTGHGRDPFPQRGASGTITPGGGSGKSSSPSANGTGSGSGSSGSQGAGGSGSSGGSSGSSGSTTTSSSGSGSTTTTTTTTTTTPQPTPKPAPAGLTDTESYTVSLGITNAYGGVRTVNAAQRLTVLPTADQPLLVELGVLKGAHRVLFAVPPGTFVSGKGSCTPGPVDCQILSLGKEQTETISLSSRDGEAVAVADFAVTGIGIAHHPSAAAANKARRSVSATGQRILSQARLSALSLFPYRPSLGVIVDQRSLKVGGT
jgi:hypothetical protein